MVFRSYAQDREHRREVRQVKQTDRLDGVTLFAYTATGSVRSMTDTDDQATSYTYDDAGNNLTEAYPEHTGGALSLHPKYYGSREP